MCDFDFETSVVKTKIECNHASLHYTIKISQTEKFRKSAHHCFMGSILASWLPPLKIVSLGDSNISCTQWWQIRYETVLEISFYILAFFNCSFSNSLATRQTLMYSIELCISNNIKSLLSCLFQFLLHFISLIYLRFQLYWANFQMYWRLFVLICSC